MNTNLTRISQQKERGEDSGGLSAAYAAESND